MEKQAAFTTRRVRSLVRYICIQILVQLLQGATAALASAKHCDSRDRYVAAVKDGHIYFATKSIGSWDQMRTECQQLGGDLASICSEELDQLVADTFVNSTWKPWIGLRRTSSSATSPFKWSDGNTCNYTHWRPGEPNFDGGNEECAHFWIPFPERGNASTRGRWNDIDCDARQHGICAVSTTKFKQPQGITGLQETSPTYTMYFLTPNSKTSAQAQAFCEANGGNLASLCSQAEDDFVYTHYTLIENSKQPFWIGYRRARSGGQFSWSDGSSCTFTNWYKGEPNNADNVEHCTEAFSTFRFGKWNDMSCDKRFYGLCKIASGLSADADDASEHTASPSKQLEHEREYPAITGLYVLVVLVLLAVIATIAILLWKRRNPNGNYGKVFYRASGGPESVENILYSEAQR